MDTLISIDETDEFYHTEASICSSFFFFGSFLISYDYFWWDWSFAIGCWFYRFYLLLIRIFDRFLLLCWFDFLRDLLRVACSYTISWWGNRNDSSIIFPKASFLNKEFKWKLAEWDLLESQICSDEIRSKIDDFICDGFIRIWAKYFTAIFDPIFDESLWIDHIFRDEWLVVNNISFDIGIREFIENTSFDGAKALVNRFSIERSHDAILFKDGYGISHTTITQTCYEFQSFLIGSDSFLRCNKCKMIDDFLAWEFSKFESLHSRYDRLWEFVWFCRCE